MGKTTFLSTALVAMTAMAFMTPAAVTAAPGFDLEASFLVCENTDCGGETSGDDTETSSEIIDASADGNTIVYSDSPGQTVGLIDITDPAAPVGLGAIELDDEPTSVAVFTGQGGTEYLLVGINSSPGFDETFDDDHDGSLFCLRTRCLYC